MLFVPDFKFQIPDLVWKMEFEISDLKFEILVMIERMKGH